VTQPALNFDGTPAPRRQKREQPIVRELRRRDTSKALVLARLEQGPATNEELNDICFRYGGRIFELKRAGYVIDKTHVEGGLWVYTLKGRR
jgi:hypothetical protein